VSLANGRIGYASRCDHRISRVPTVPAAKLLYLRNVGDSDRIKAAFQASSWVAVIGAG
jgi:hypothetical protein